MTNRLLLCCALWVCGTLAAPPRPAPAAGARPPGSTPAAARRLVILTEMTPDAVYYWQ